MKNFKKLKKSEQINKFADKCAEGPEQMQCTGELIIMSQEVMQMILIMEGIKSKKNRIAKKVIKRFWNKAILEGLKLSENSSVSV